MRRIIIVGATSGLGNELAKIFIPWDGKPVLPEDGPLCWKNEVCCPDQVNTRSWKLPGRGSGTAAGSDTKAWRDGYRLSQCWNREKKPAADPGNRNEYYAAECHGFRKHDHMCFQLYERTRRGSHCGYYFCCRHKGHGTQSLLFFH